MIKFYNDSGCTEPIRSVLGTLVGDASVADIYCGEEPSQVRRYSASENWGFLLTPTEHYTYSTSSGTIMFIQAPAVGETCVAFSAGDYIFQGMHAVGNDADTANRTLEQRIYLKSENAHAVDLKLVVNNLFEEDELHACTICPISTKDHFIALNSGSAPDTYQAGYTPLDVGDLANDAVTSVWVKAVIPFNTNMDNYHNIYLSIESENFSTHL